MKKLLLLLIAVTIIFTVQTTSANGFKLTVDSKTAYPGETIAIDLTFSNNSGIIAALFELEYDRERLELIKTEDKALLEGAVFSQNYDNYPYIMLWNSASSKNFTNNGVLVTLTFKVIDNAKKGNAYINISYNSENVYDVDLNNVDIHINNGAINVLDGDTSNIKNPDEEYGEEFNEEYTASEDTGYTSSKTTKKGEHNIAENTNAETTPVSSTHTFDDVKNGDWYYGAVSYAVENKLMNGVSNTEFAPDNPLTRAMLVTVLYRNEGEPNVEKNADFNDVNNSMYYADAVDWAWQNKIINGVSETNFAPDNFITREQIATIIYRYASYKSYDLTAETNTDLLLFSDAEEISEYATDAFKYSVCKGLINGKSATTLNPADTATRAETAAILMRFLELNK